jgi:hypothetical protein
MHWKTAHSGCVPICLSRYARAPARWQGPARDGASWRRSHPRYSKATPPAQKGQPAKLRFTRPAPTLSCGYSQEGDCARIKPGRHWRLPGVQV